MKEYRNNSNITFEDIVDFHYKFEKIHPFQDGNGRVGRLIIFKEYTSEKWYLLDTCRASQDAYKKLLQYFEYI